MKENNGWLKFEGEYLNGKRNGKAKEYDGDLIFEGEYKNGKKWNGKCHNGDGDLIYEIKEGKGYVKEHLEKKSKKSIRYIGEYLNGDRNGIGEEYNICHGDSLIYKGEYLNGKRNGKGKEYFGKYLIFDGEYLNGKRWNGRLYTSDDNFSFYEIKNGKGKYIELNFIDRFIFEGEYINGERNGKGKEYTFGQKIFDGEY